MWLSAEPTQAGQTVICPGCQTQFPIPLMATPAASPPPLASAPHQPVAPQSPAPGYPTSPPMSRPPGSARRSPANKDSNLSWLWLSLAALVVLIGATIGIVLIWRASRVEGPGEVEFGLPPNRTRFDSMRIPGETSFWRHDAAEQTPIDQLAQLRFSPLDSEIDF